MVNTAELAAIAALVACGDADRTDEVLRLPEALAAQLALTGDAGHAVRMGAEWERLTVLGRGAHYATAFEAALKVRELDGIVAEAYSPADLRHGPIATVGPGQPVLAIAPDGRRSRRCASSWTRRERAARPWPRSVTRPLTAIRFWLWSTYALYPHRRPGVRPAPQRILCTMLQGAALGEDVGPQVEAGRAALAVGDWEAARDAFQRSLDAGPSASAFEGLGLASRWLGTQDAAIRSLQQAYRLHRRADERRAAARVALHLCLCECYFHDDIAVGLGWVERADRLLEDSEPGAEHGWLALLRGHLALQVDRDPARARAHAARAREIGRETGVVDIEMMAIALEGLTLVSEGEVDEGMRRLDQATAATVAGELADLDAISSCCCYLIDACKRVRDFERAAQWCEHVKGFCEQWSDRLTFAACRAHYADILIWRGEWTAAESELRSSLGPLADIHPNRIADGMVRLAELRRRQGLLEESSRLLEAADGHFLAPLVRAALALDRGDAAGAAHEAQRALRRLPAEGLTDRAPALEILVRARLDMGERQAAQDAADELRAIASSAGTGASGAAAAFADGLLAAAAESWEAARTAFEDAVDLYARAGGRWEGAHARRQMARALRALGHDAAAEREARAADEALRALGAHTTAPDGATAPAGLTARELEVLRLVAHGHSNQEIAGELVLSVRTVERHIANIYDKIGASGRAARAAAASYAIAAGVA